jgi:hypothetical protein
MDRTEPLADVDQGLLAAPRDQMSRRFVAAWLAWRSTGRLVPMRGDVELGDIKALLGRVLLFELVGPTEILVKVAGSQLRDHAAFEATGKNFAELTPPGQWPLRQWRMEQMAARPCGGIMITRGDGASGFGATFETVTLPLAPDAPGKPRLLMSNVAVVGGVYEPPAKDRPHTVPLVDEFRFLDLGAGVPDKATP